VGCYYCVYTHNLPLQSSRYEGIEGEGGGYSSSTTTESQRQPLMHPSLEDDQERRFEDSMKRIEVRRLATQD
jgi:hypothetical protein